MGDLLRVDKIDAQIVQAEKRVSIGRLSQEMIDDIARHAPGIASQLSTDRDIIFWEDRIEHTERHRDDFFSPALYDQCFEEIPLFIQEPDYITTRKNGLVFIRIFSQNVAVAVRVSTSGALSYRTMYVITEAQIDHFLASGETWRRS